MKNVKLQWQRGRYQHASGNYTGFPVTTVEHHLMATLLIWPRRYHGHFFRRPCKNRQTFSCKKNPLSYGHFFQGF